MNRILRRIATWTTCRALGVRCAITGHNYGRHFTDLFVNTASWTWEIPWCDRCGKEVVR